MSNLFLIPKYTFLSAETLMTIRALGRCESKKLQEFARIIFVDDYSTHKPKYEDHEPLTQRPSYDSLNVPKIVSKINRKYTYRLD